MVNSKLIVHVSEVDLTERGGMGRVELSWKREFERRGYRFVHIGPSEVGRVAHKGLFPFAAYLAYLRLREKAALIIAHEPTAGIFANSGCPLVVESHGIERRYWQWGLDNRHASWRSRILYPIWRLVCCDVGIKSADLVLVCNQEDLAFVLDHYHRSADEVFVFRNGVIPTQIDATIQPDALTACFVGSWLQRKGVSILIKAADILQARGSQLRWLIGTNISQDQVLREWPPELRMNVEVVTDFSPEGEQELLARSNMFVLASEFEGQPLSLLQAMETGRCCITTNCCGQKDAVVHGENGFLFERDDAEQLADLLQQCMEDGQLRLRIGHHAKGSMRLRSWDVTSAEVVDRVEQMLCGR